MSARFLVAKYTPDLRRMEPRNIGVVLWSDGEMVAKFIGEKRNGTIDVDPPSRLKMHSHNAYRQWLFHWRHAIEGKAIRDSAGALVRREDPRFVDALLSKSKQQYMLVDGGRILERVQTQEMKETLDDLFANLVLEDSERIGATDKREVIRALHHSSTKVLRETGIAKRKDFFSDYWMACHVGETTQAFHFDYALHREKPKVLMTRVLLARAQSVHATAFRFQQMQLAFGVPREKCASFVYATEADFEIEEIAEAYKMMNSIGVSVNFADESLAAEQLISLAA
jgi:hypothetical protein